MLGFPGVRAARAFRAELLPERAAVSSGLASHLGDVDSASEEIDLIHAQHVLTGPASVMAARARRHPVGLHGPRLLAACATGAMCCARSGGRRYLSRLFRRGDDALSAAARRRRMASDAAGHSLHARQPPAKQNRCRRSPTRSSSWRQQVTSVTLRERCARDCGRPRIEVIPNGVDVARRRALDRGCTRGPWPNHTPCSWASSRTTKARTRSSMWSRGRV